MNISKSPRVSEIPLILKAYWRILREPCDGSSSGEAGARVYADGGQGIGRFPRGRESMNAPNRYGPPACFSGRGRARCVENVGGGKRRHVAPGQYRRWKRGMCLPVRMRSILLQAVSVHRMRRCSPGLIPPSPSTFSFDSYLHAEVPEPGHEISLAHDILSLWY